MTGVLLLLERVAGEVPAARRELFAEAQEATRKSVEEVRRIAQELRPELLEHLGLVSALKSLATTLHRAGRASSSSGTSRASCRRSHPTWSWPSIASPKRA